MRKIFFALCSLLFPAASSALDFPVSVNLYSQPTVKASSVNNEKPSFRLRSGIKFSSPFVAGVCFYDFPGQKEVKWGSEVSLNPKILPFSMKALGGNLRFSSSFSKMKSPGIVSVSPLSCPSLPAHGIFPSLPSSSAGEGKLSFAAVLDRKNGSSLIPDIQAAFTPDEKIMVNMTNSFSPLFFDELTFSLTSGLFFHDNEKCPASWFVKRPYYKGRWFFLNLVQFNAVVPHLRISQSLGFNEIPSGDFSLWSRTQMIIRAGGFSVNLLAFISEPSLVTADGSTCSQTVQLAAAPVFEYSFLGADFVTGVSFLENFDESSVLRFGQKFFLGKFSSTLNCSRKRNGDYGISCSAGLKVKKGKLKAYASLKHSGSSENHTASFSYEPGQSVLNSLSLTAESLSLKNKLTLSSVLAWGGRRFKVNLSASAVLSFDKK